MLHLASTTIALFDHDLRVVASYPVATEQVTRLADLLDPLRRPTAPVAQA